MTPSLRLRSPRTALWIALLLTMVPRSVRAELPVEAGTAGPLDWLQDAADGRLLPGFQPAGARVGGEIQRGLVLGVELGPEYSTPQAAQTTTFDLTLGIQAGYAFGNGVTVLGRFDALGNHPLLLPTPKEDLFAVGVRYAFPWFVEPFAEGDIGLGLLDNNFGEDTGLFGNGATVCGGVTAGVLLPIGPHFALSLAARDWLSFLQEQTTQALALEVGFELILGPGILSH